MIDWAHILERFLIHFFSAGGFLLGAVTAWQWAVRRWDFVWEWVELILPALVIFSFAATREAYDVWNGGSLVKSAFDLASWLLGLGVTAWGLYRFGQRQ